MQQLVKQHLMLITECHQLCAEHGRSVTGNAWGRQVMFQNRTGKLALVDLYYEWGKGRNANLIHSQLGSTLYDIGASVTREAAAQSVAH